MSSETKVGRGEYAALAYWEMVAREIGQFNANVRKGVNVDHGTRTKEESSQRGEGAGDRRVGGDCG